jgi:hypothetical protein
MRGEACGTFKAMNELPIGLKMFLKLCIEKLQGMNIVLFRTY